MRIDELFGSGQLVRDREYGMVSLLRGHSLGKLWVPSGQLLAGDPHELPYLEPIAVPAGEAARMPEGIRVAGDKIGRFVVIDKLGEGGMGAVYAAHDPSLHRRVAIKLLRREISDPARRTALAALSRLK